MTDVVCAQLFFFGEGGTKPILQATVTVHIKAINSNSLDFRFSPVDSTLAASFVGDSLKRKRMARMARSHRSHPESTASSVFSAFLFHRNMAEAFAALSIAANIAQFVDYARQLISGGKEIYNSLDGT